VKTKVKRDKLLGNTLCLKTRPTMLSAVTPLCTKWKAKSKIVSYKLHAIKYILSSQSGLRPGLADALST